jgi:hypothetical protein
MPKQKRFDDIMEARLGSSKAMSEHAESPIASLALGSGSEHAQVVQRSAMWSPHGGCGIRSDSCVELLFLPAVLLLRMEGWSLDSYAIAKFVRRARHMSLPVMVLAYWHSVIDLHEMDVLSIGVATTVSILLQSLHRWLLQVCSPPPPFAGRAQFRRLMAWAACPPVPWQACP